MGKIRIRALGVDELEKKQKKEARLASEAKRAKKQQEKKTVKAPGLKGGERVIAVGPTEEEISNVEPTAAVQEEEAKEAKKSREAGSGSARKTAKTRVRSKRYQAVSASVDKTKRYPLTEALDILPKLHLSSFDESVELHINTIEQGLSGTVTLPHGTGKKIRVAIADDTLIGEIEKGKINFDVLLAEPSIMPKLAKVAKILGPRGFMPNPKNGTITTNPQETIKKFEAGQIRFKTEAKAPIIHLTVGKLSFGEKKLAENIASIIDAVNKEKIKNVTLKSTMSPGIKLDISTK